MSNLMSVRGEPVQIDPDGRIHFHAGMTIDADGSPRAYHPDSSKGLDDLANAGYPGNWFGLVTDSGGQPYVQRAADPAPGFFVSATAYEDRRYSANDPRRYLDSETVPYIVVPGPLRRKVGPVVLGCRARVTFAGRSVNAIVGDVGPATHLGEGSIALARALGIPASARHGGRAASDILYELWPGASIALGNNPFPYQLQSA